MTKLDGNTRECYQKVAGQNKKGKQERQKRKSAKCKKNDKKGRKICVDEPTNV
jgi:hypothetical protein